MVCWSWLVKAGQHGHSWFRLVSQTDQSTSAQNSPKTKKQTMLWEQPRFQTVSPQKVIFYIPLNTCSPTYTNCTGIKHSLTPWCGGEKSVLQGSDCSSLGGPVFEVQDTRGTMGQFLLCCVLADIVAEMRSKLCTTEHDDIVRALDTRLMSVWLRWNLAQQSFNNIKKRQRYLYRVADSAGLVILSEESLLSAVVELRAGVRGI